MALDQYDRYFGGERGAAKQTLENMQKTYGKRDGEAVFTAAVAKRKRKARPAKPSTRGVRKG
jgi:hypothetical protein